MSHVIALPLDLSFGSQKVGESKVIRCDTNAPLLQDIYSQMMSNGSLIIWRFSFRHDGGTPSHPFWLGFSMNSPSSCSCRGTPMAIHGHPWAWFHPHIQLRRTLMVCSPCTSQQLAGQDPRDPWSWGRDQTLTLAELVQSDGQKHGQKPGTTMENQGKNRRKTHLVGGLVAMNFIFPEILGC